FALEKRPGIIFAPAAPASGNEPVDSQKIFPAYERALGQKIVGEAAPGAKAGGAGIFIFPSHLFAPAPGAKLRGACFPIFEKAFPDGELPGILICEDLPRGSRALGTGRAHRKGGFIEHIAGAGAPEAPPQPQLAAQES